MDFLLEQFKVALQSNQFLAGGLFLGLLSLIGYKLRDYANFLWIKFKTLTIFSVYIDDSYYGMYRQFTNWYNSKYPEKFRNVEAISKMSYDIVSRKHMMKLELKQFMDSNFIWYKRRLIFIQKERETFSSSTSRDNFYVNKYIVRGFLAKDAILDLLRTIGEYEIKLIEDEQRVAIHFYDEYWHDNNKENCVIKSFDQLFFKEKEQIISILKTFKENFNRYFELGVPYKTGFLFFGPGGTGKSSTATAIANYLNYPIYCLNLSAIEKDSQLIRAISSIPSKSILLLEDIDRFLPANCDKAKFNLGTLLNCIDGNSSLNNCVIIMTTNHINNIDPVLIRSGRIDHKIEISYPEKENVEQMLSKFFKQDVKLNNFNKKLTMSDVQSIALGNSLEDTLEKIQQQEDKALKAVA